MTKVFVGNFDFSVDDERLKEYFSEVGTVVSAKVMREAGSGKPRGFGFVEFSSPDEAKTAISQLHGSNWEGRVIKVCEERRNNRDSSHDSSDSGDGEDGSRHVPTGYFRAQPLELVLKKRKKTDPFVEDPNLAIDYKDPRLLVKFMSERGRILPRRMTGLDAMNQRRVTVAIKRAQQLALLPYLKD